MEKRLFDVLNGRGENYILPFFWQHGEKEELLREGMDRIYESGIGAVCVESRPHPDFLGERWWKDLDVIMEKAREKGMRVWVLDDAHFPSGYCNGKIDEASPYGKTYLTHYSIDSVGPLKGRSFMVRLEPGEELIGVTLSRRSRRDGAWLREVQDISSLVRNGRVQTDIPKGTWCVTVIKTTRKGTGRKNYINSIDRKAVRFFLDTVYEAHYNHYKSDFGKTFAGFFSDEPEIGNCLGEYGHDAHIGQPDMQLPWSGEVKRRLEALWGTKLVTKLLSLWMNTDIDQEKENRTGYLRYQFMEIISDLYGKNFCTQIGDWCREHDVEYIGHVIEDGGSHAHLGLGTGHFFRALWGQDMSGIDVVLQQIRPELDDFPFYSIGGTSHYHGELFHYGLAKLGSSLGHLDPKKKGRTMCEVFGAYGWSEGVKLMKWLMDHMLVNGVNYYVPHAFTMKEFPDPDCPPHFYARGMNPQFPYFRYLMEYCNRVSHLLSGGHHVPCTAILYTAEQEWMGEYRPFEKDARVLTRNQIDFEVLPMESLLDGRVLLSETDDLKDKKMGSLLCWGEGMASEQVGSLVIPGSRCILKSLADWIDGALAKGVTVVFTERIPLVLEEDGTLTMRWEKYEIADTSGVYTTALAKKDTASSSLNSACLGPVLCREEKLAGYLKARAAFEIETLSEAPWLRYYHYEQKDGGYWLFFTETVTGETDTEIHFAKGAPDKACWYDPWTNHLEPLEWTNEGRLKLHLSPYEMKILYTGDLTEEEEKQLTFLSESRVMADQDTEELAEEKYPWTLETREVGSEECIRQNFVPVLGDLGSDERLPFFSGTMYYRTFFNATEGKRGSLDLGEVYEAAKVLVNGKDAGVRIAPPYHFDLTGLLKDGENTLEIQIANTLVNRQRDFMSMTMPMEPSGLIGPVRITLND